MELTQIFMQNLLGNRKYSPASCRNTFISFMITPSLKLKTHGCPNSLTVSTNAITFAQDTSGRIMCAVEHR